MAGTERLIDILGAGADAPSDTFPPFIQNIVPSNLANGVPLAQDLSFLIDDLETGIDQTTILVEVDEGGGFVIAYDGSGGGFQTGWDGGGSSIVAGGANGFNVTIDKTTDWSNFSGVTWRIYGEDVEGNSVQQTVSFTTADELAPFVTNEGPAPGATDILLDTDISFTIDDDGSGVDLTTVQVTVDGVNAVVNGVIQALYNGPNAAVNSTGNGYAFVLDRIGNLPEASQIDIVIDAEDNAANAMTQVVYSFTTVATTFVPTGGGSTFTISDIIPAGDYIVHIGPTQSVADPIAYSGVPGGGAATTFVDQGGGISTATVYMPNLPVGGPYLFYLEGVDIASQSPLITVEVIPRVFRNKGFSLKHILPPHYKTGPRTAQQVRFPQ